MGLPLRHACRLGRRPLRGELWRLAVCLWADGGADGCGHGHGVVHIRTRRRGVARPAFRPRCIGACHGLARARGGGPVSRHAGARAGAGHPRLRDPLQIRRCARRHDVEPALCLARLQQGRIGQHRQNLWLYRQPGGSRFGRSEVLRLGVMRALLLCGVLQMLANLMYAVQVWAGHNQAALALTIGLENLLGGMGSAAFVAYLSGLCRLAFTATQYALLSSLAAVGRTTLSASGGALADAFGWVPFFLLSAVACLPGLLLLVWLMHRERRRDPSLAAAQP